LTEPLLEVETYAAELESVAWLCEQDGRLLGVRTRGRDRFYLPGGKIEPGESHAQALVREVREELGLTLSDVEHAFSVVAPAHGLAVSTRLTMHCFRADAAGTPVPAREIEEMAWLDIAGDDRAAPAVQAALSRLASECGLMPS
jgi:8-oxo-dGTP pyrophosphatase MutT (NUDIX family)